MKKSFLGIIGITLFSLSGCFTPYSQSPVATNFKTTYQKKLQAAAHWNVIADDIANNISKHVSKYTSLYIKKENNTTFNDTFYEMLTSKLVQRGYKIKRNENSADAVLDINSKSIYFTRKLSKYNRVGTLVAIGSGVYLASVATGPQIAVAGVFGAEAYNIYNSKFDSIPHRELVLNINVYNKNDYLYSLTRTYYIVDKDNKLYKPKEKYYTISIQGQ
jgi:hypothetical protein